MKTTDLKHALAAIRPGWVVALVGVVSLLIAPPARAGTPYDITLELADVGGGKAVIGGFLAVSGLEDETEVVEVRSGDGETTVKVPGRTSWDNIVLQRGTTTRGELWSWYQAVRSGGPFPRRDGAIVVSDASGNTVLRYSFKQAFPVRWAAGLEEGERGPAPALETIALAIESAEVGGVRRPASAGLRVRLEADGLTASFLSISGLELDTEVLEHRDGSTGELRKVPGRTRTGPILLRRPLGQGTDLWPWRRTAIGGTPDRKSGAIILLDTDGQTEIARYNFIGAWPKSFRSAPTSTAGKGMGIERIELAVDYVERAGPSDG